MTIQSELFIFYSHKKFKCGLFFPKHKYLSLLEKNIAYWCIHKYSDSSHLMKTPAIHIAKQLFSSIMQPLKCTEEKETRPHEPARAVKQLKG